MPPKRKGQSKSSTSAPRPPPSQDVSSRTSSAPPSTTRRSRKASKLESLPDPVLRRIFFQIAGYLDSGRSTQTLYLSRRLLPFALQHLYTEIQTYTSSQFILLFAALQHRPILGTYVRFYQLHFLKLGSEGVPESSTFEKLPLMSRSAKRKEARLKAEQILDDIVPASKEVPFDPSRWIFCDSLVQELFKLLPNLSELYLFTKSIIPSIFEPLISTSLFSSLRRVTVQLTIPQQVLDVIPEENRRYIKSENYDDVTDSDICAHLSRLPALQEVTFIGNTSFMPFGTDSEPSSIDIEPESWPLESFVLSNMSLIDDLSEVFSSFTSNLTTITLRAAEFSTNLAEDLLLLPDSLLHLHIMVGLDYCGANPYISRLSLPPIDEAILRLTKLETLQLDGPLISPTFWEQVTVLDKLKHFCLGHHVPLDAGQILSFIKDPKQLTQLERLCLSICHCPINRDEDLTHQPRWRELVGEGDNGGSEPGESLTVKDGYRIYNALKRAKVKVGGGLECALRKCDKTDPNHECLRAYAPIPGGFTC